ncbi:unnamed protein product [Ilex paraguariensis]|uniref:Uncharacterized protein n=1 Tax=Ilex paraguariensis TaxID=185542 RepID=A0ABC8V761_9AQUA
MAAFSSFADSNLKKPLPKPLMLKDYLLDDLSSCSSNGFRSYPRRQCCTTIQFLLEIDLKDKPSPHKKKSLPKSRSKSTPSNTISAFQRASEVVINAVKFLPFTAVNSSSKDKKLTKSILPRSLSKKLLRRSFWKKTGHKDIERWKSFRELIEEEKSKPLDFSPSVSTTTTDITSSTTVSNRDSWSDSEFTSSENNLEGNSEIALCENDVVVLEGKRSSPAEKEEVNDRVGVAVGEDSMEASSTTTNSSVRSTKNEWPSEGKEQFSPVSVLDCPFDDEDEVSSPFQQSLARMEGTKKKLMQKIRRFESLAHLEPVDLQKRITLLESDHESLESPPQPSSTSMQDYILTDQEEEDKIEERTFELLHLIKAAIPSNSKLMADDLLLDLVKERIVKGLTNTLVLTKANTFDSELLDEVKNWMNDQHRELLLEWEVPENRQAYLRDMEKGGTWTKLDEEKQEVALELEFDVFASLVDEPLPNQQDTIMATVNEEDKEQQRQ